MSEADAAAAPRAITNRRLLAVALPIVVSNATVPILGAVDTGVVGQLGEAAPIGAVGVGAVILTAIYWIFGFLRMGTVGLTSQAFGRGDRPEADAMLSRALMVALTAGAGLILLQVPIFAGAFLIAPASEEVETLAQGYLGIRVFSAPAAISIYGITGWLIAAERTRAVLVIQLWMNGLNIALDLIFVLGMGWGVSGVATATFLSEWSGLALGLWLCRDAFRGGHWRDVARVFDRVRLKRMASVNTDILIRSVLLQAVFVSFLFLGSDLGDVPLAANQILLQFLYVTSYALDGFAFAAETLVGQAFGRARRDLVRRASVLSGAWSAGAAAVLAAAFALLGGMVIDTMTTSEAVREAAHTYLPWMVLAPLVGAASWALDGIFIGATATRDMRNMMVISVAGYFAAVAVLLPTLGNHGLWLALMVSFTLRGLTLGVRYPALEARAG